MASGQVMGQMVEKGGKVKKAQRGGEVQGPQHPPDQVPILATGGEVVLDPPTVAMVEQFDGSPEMAMAIVAQVQEVAQRSPEMQAKQFGGPIDTSGGNVFLQQLAAALGQNVPQFPLTGQALGPEGEAPGVRGTVSTLQPQDEGGSVPVLSEEEKRNKVLEDAQRRLSLIKSARTLGIQGSDARLAQMEQEQQGTVEKLAEEQVARQRVGAEQQRAAALQTQAEAFQTQAEAAKIAAQAKATGGTEVFNQTRDALSRLGATQPDIALERGIDVSPQGVTNAAVQAATLAGGTLGAGIPIDEGTVLAVAQQLGIPPDPAGFESFLVRHQVEGLDTLQTVAKDRQSAANLAGVVLHILQQEFDASRAQGLSDAKIRAKMKTLYPNLWDFVSTIGEQGAR
jgi:hypothetical protein